MAMNRKTESQKTATKLVNAVILLSNLGPIGKYEACRIAAMQLEKEWPSLAPAMHAMADKLYTGEGITRRSSSCAMPCV
jgi:hypothetical protein